MKKLLFVLPLFLLSTLLPAQTGKGDQSISLMGWGRANRFILPEHRWALSGTTSLHYQYFLARNFSAGVAMEYRFSRPATANLIFILPEARYYFLDGGVRPFVYAAAGTGWLSYPGSSYGIRRLPFRTDVGAGVSWFVSPRWAIEGRAGITTYWTKGNPSSSLDLKIGVKYSIPHREKKKVPSY